MDELDLLKKDWKTSNTEYTNFTNEDLYTMLHKRSASIVKTLFYISIAELFFWLIINVLPYFNSENYKNKIDESYKNPWFVVITLVSFAVIFVFMYLLYKSHKSISTTENAKKLMESILKTRKIIKYYVLYNLIFIFISIPLSLYFEFNQNKAFHNQIEALSTKQMLVVYALTILLTGILLLVFWLFYRLIYGILLKRLNKNYKELKKLEI